MLEVYDDVMIECPLMEKEIPETMCYEINLVVDNVAIPSFVPEVNNWYSALKLCPHCKVSYYRDVREYRGEVI
jgi:hypothetical protein